MRKLPRHLTIRVERDVAETFHAKMAVEGRTASAYLREVVKAAVAAPAGPVAPSAPITAEAA